MTCLKTDETFKNKQNIARTKKALKNFKQPVSRIINNPVASGLLLVILPVSKIAKEQLRTLGINMYRFDILRFPSLTVNSVANMFVIFSALITLITPANAFEIDESSSSISINKPIMRDVPDHAGWVRFSPEYVRCFCNLPACVSTGYMCKSSGGGCFSDLLDQANQAIPSNVYRGIHGCLELLTDRDQRDWCQNNPTSTSRSSYKKKNHPKSLLLCCYHDMCNHADSPETKYILNDSAVLAGDTTNDSDNKISENVGAKQDPALYTESEVWFRAATIAVPICGAVILLALIGLAVKLLRTESSANANHKLGMSYSLSSDMKSNCDKMQRESYRQHNIIHQDNYLKDSHHHNPIYLGDVEDVGQQTYVPLLIQNEMRIIDKNCDIKNETNAKLNYMQDVDHYKINSCDDSNLVSKHLLHKNTDLHLERNMVTDGNLFECQDSSNDKVYDKEIIS